MCYIFFNNPNMSANTALNGTAILPVDNRTSGNIDTTTDTSWVKRSFMISDDNLKDITDQQNRYWSSANGKFTDSRLGCNIGINARPQITPYSDIRVKGRLRGRNDVSPADTSGNYGLGRYYSEAYDDPAQIVYLRFGVPQFNSLFSFLSRAFDINQSGLTRTGRIPGVMADLGTLFGTYLAVTVAPVIALPWMIGKVYGALFGSATSKFYTLKPTMYLYWSTVNTLVNAIAVNAGIWPKIMGSLGPNKDDTQKLGKPFKLDQEYMSAFSEAMPDIFSGQNYFDIFALANRAQRLANQVYADDFDKLDQGTASDFFGYLKKEATGDLTHSTGITNKEGSVNISFLINRVVSLSHYFKSEGEGSVTMEPSPMVEGEGDAAGGGLSEKLKKYAEYFDAEFKMGAQFAVFRVDHTGSVSESFSNSATESDLSQKLNSTSSTFQQARFSMAGGNLIGGVVGDAVGAVVNGVTDFLGNTANSFLLGVPDLVKGLMGDGYVDIPKHWQSSSASLTEQTYNIDLVTPYGNVMSWMMNITIPLCMLLAGALPRSVGKSSYTSPFLVQIFDRGRCQIRLGMIESLSITRGTGDLAFDTQGRPLAVKVSFKVKDLSSIMHMPVSSGQLLKADMTLDEDNILADYLAVIAGQDMYSQIYPMSKARLNAAKVLMSWQKLGSAAFWAAKTRDILTSGILSPIGAVIEGLSRGAETTAGAG